MATNNSGSFSQSKPFTEAIKSRIEALDPGRPEPGSAVCNECGSPLSEASQFCWMCGASRSMDRDPRVDPTSGPVLLKSSPASSAAKPISPSTSFVAPPVSGTAALSYTQVPAQEAPPPELVQPQESAAQEPEPPPQHTPPAPQERMFEPDFRPKLADAFMEEQQPENKKFSIVRIVVTAVLLVIVAILGYWQRNNFRITYDMLKVAIAEQWKSDEESQRMPPYTNPAASVRARKHLRATPAPSVRPASQTAMASFSPRRLPLGISVRGQQSQSPSLLTASDGLVLNGAVQVGISDSLITTAKLSPMAIEISPRESLALLIRRVPPKYPEQARKLGTQGSVVLKVVIQKDGNVGDVRAITGDQLLIPAAIDAVRQWMYKPYYRDGVPTEVETFVTVEFSLASPVSPAN